MVSSTVLPVLQAATARLKSGAGAIDNAHRAAQPHQLCQQLLQHRSLLARPAVAAAIEHDAKRIVQLLGQYLEHLETSAHGRASACRDAGQRVTDALAALHVIKRKAETAQQVLQALAAAHGQHSSEVQAASQQAADLKQTVSGLERVCYSINASHGGPSTTLAMVSRSCIYVRTHRACTAEHTCIPCRRHGLLFDTFEAHSENHSHSVELCRNAMQLGRSARSSSCTPCRAGRLRGCWRLTLQLAGH